MIIVRSVLYHLCRLLRSLLLCLCDVFRALINSLVWYLCGKTLNKKEEAEKKKKSVSVFNPQAGTDCGSREGPGGWAEPAVAEGTEPEVESAWMP